MKTLIFTLLLITLFACESKRTYDFSCNCVYTFHYIDDNPLNDACQWTMTRIGVPLKDYTYDEMIAYRNAQETPRHYFNFYGVLWDVTCKCNCLEGYCPEKAVIEINTDSLLIIRK
jgi:hypothetical protein